MADRKSMSSEDRILWGKVDAGAIRAGHGHHY
mgnify:CR=1 FL=1